MASSSRIIPLPYLRWDSNDQKQAFRGWKTLLLSYFTIANPQIDDDKRWPYILLTSGSRGHPLWESWALTDAQKADSATVFNKFDMHLDDLESQPNK